MHKLNFIFALIMALALFGCKTKEQYKDEAADSAREFLFDKYKNMSPENKTHIKCSYPKILTAPIFTGSQYSQFCFAWDLPSPKVTLMAYGPSKNNLKFWHPVRAVIKKYPEDQFIGEEAIALEQPRAKRTGIPIPIRKDMNYIPAVRPEMETIPARTYMYNPAGSYEYAPVEEGSEDEKDGYESL